MAGIEHIRVDADEAGMRLDRWFKIHYPGLGFGALQKLLRSGQIRVDGGRVKSDTPCSRGRWCACPPWMSIRRDRRPGRFAGKDLKHSGDAELLARMLLHEDDKVFRAEQAGWSRRPVARSGVTRHIDKMLDAWVNQKGEKPRSGASSRP